MQTEYIVGFHAGKTKEMFGAEVRTVAILAVGSPEPQEPKPRTMD